MSNVSSSGATGTFLGPVNDTMGHQAGDKLLCAVSERLRQAIRNSDTLARMGGDEFIVLIENLDEDAAISTTAAKLVAAFAAPSPAWRPK